MQNNSYKIAIRADGNSEIASGHIMRCLSIADEFEILGKEVVFISASADMKNLIEKRGYENIVLNTKYNDLDSEVDVLIEFLKECNPLKIIVDSYYVTENYLNKLSKIGYDTIYIDDLNMFKYPVNTIVNYSVYAKKSDYLYCNNSLVGPQYAPLRKQYFEVYPRKIKSVENIFVSTGGTDTYNISEKILNILSNIECFVNVKINIVVGSMNTNYGNILSISQKNKNIIIHENVTDMANLMLQCDIAISAAGSTLYELCACGVPTICYTFADNQLLAAKTFAEMSCMLYAGDYREKLDNFETSIREDCIKLFCNDSIRNILQNNMRKLVDGKGVKRLCKKLLSS